MVLTSMLHLIHSHWMLFIMLAWFPGVLGEFDPKMHNCCQLSSSLLYSLSSLNGNIVNITCTGQYFQYLTSRKGIRKLFLHRFSTLL